MLRYPVIQKLDACHSVDQFTTTIGKDVESLIQMSTTHQSYVPRKNGHFNSDTVSD